MKYLRDESPMIEAFLIKKWNINEIFNMKVILNLKIQIRANDNTDDSNVMFLIIKWY